MDDDDPTGNREYTRRTRGVIASLEASGKLPPSVEYYMRHGEEGLAVAGLLATLNQYEDLRDLLTPDDRAFLRDARADFIAEGVEMAKADYLEGPQLWVAPRAKLRAMP